ncbi:MAG: hypothetical protein H7A32_03330 [Deltaproteobacteria bacterium]|nr:hypothetical protein [Deltaproteobacteria bacterium]
MKTFKNIFFSFLLILSLAPQALGKEASPTQAKENSSQDNNSKKDTTSQKTNNKTGELSAQEISETMSINWCHKLEVCAPDSGMETRECRNILKKSFKEGFERIAPGHQVNVTQTQLNQCVASLKTSSCAQLQNAEKLQGCDFITYLNRQ